jgi:PKHD-type hydroxylase
MLLRIPGILKNDELALARSWLAGARFVDGRLSAGAAAQRVKQNQELDANARELEQMNTLVMGALTRHSVYRGAALPLHVASPYYARYRPGMAYGEHLDDPIMGAGGVLYRSDIAITIFLNAPQDYDGGELAIQTAFGEQTVKLPAGDGVLYPASRLHRVTPVTRGERLVAVTWVQSLVRDPGQRELLYNLNQAREHLLHSAPEAPATAQVDAAYMNLVRMWSDI